MNLKQKTIGLLAKYGLKPKKLFGQNFLISEIYFQKIINELHKLDKETPFVEIGPGPGIITAELAKNFKNLIVIEKDKNISELLNKELKSSLMEVGLPSISSIEIINEDILKFNFEKNELKNFGYNVFGNIPYYLTSALIRKILESKTKPQTIFFTIQKEVAQRIYLKNSAGNNPPKPDFNSQKTNILGLSVKFYAESKILFYIPKNAFWPAPKVDSAFIKITPKKLTPETELLSDYFFKTVKTAFSSPRKQIKNNLTKLNIEPKILDSILRKIDINPKSRPEDLSFEKFIELAKEISKYQ